MKIKWNMTDIGWTNGILNLNKDRSTIVFNLLIPKQEIWFVFKIEIFNKINERTGTGNLKYGMENNMIEMI